MNKYLNSSNTIILVAVLTLIAIASRFLLIDWPNFKPVAAIALFLGFYCQDRRIAVLTVVGILLITDWFFGFYSPILMLSVYSSIVLACGLGILLNPWLRKTNLFGARIGLVTVSAIAASLVFYLVTNVAVALVSPWYPNTMDGILLSLVAGIPFFKYTLAGNIMFGLGIFSSYFAWESRVLTRAVQSNACIQ